MIKFYKLLDYLNRNEIVSSEFCQKVGITNPTWVKLRTGGNIQTEIINRICKAYNLQPSDIMEYIPDKEEKAD